MRKIVILGNGVAGITAARHIRKSSDDEILVVSAESDHFFSRTALMYVYMGHMKFEHIKPYEDQFWEKNRIRLLRAHVRHIHFEDRALEIENGRRVLYDQLILATGSTPNRFGWPGQDLDGVQSLYSKQDLELMEANTAGMEQGAGRAVVAGGGLIGIEMTEMMLTRQIPVTFLVRESSWMERVTPPEESQMINQHIRHHGVDLRLGTELREIVGDDAGRVRGVVTTDGEEIPCSFVGLTVGVSPNVSFLRDTELEMDRGILVDEHLRTNLDGVWAIGDCAQLRQPAEGRRPVEAIWYTARAMGEVVARNLCNEVLPYRQDIFFNSAKFFDLEWQIYGTVPAQPGEGEASLFWQHADGTKSLRIHYRSSDLAVLGFNLMGIRYRHELCHQWIADERPLPWVLENLGAANFDPELYRQHEKDLVDVYNQQHPGRPVRLKRRRGLKHLLSLGRAS